jgi:ABC-2 type transport system ATP-binding protein
LIEVEGLSKRYGQHLAIDRLSFSVERGEILGFLGPNGAGKSTTMNIITGYISATEGRASVGGHDVLEQPMLAKRLIGYLPETPPLYPEMTVMEYLCFACDIKGVARAARGKLLDELVGQVGIGDIRRRLIRNLSKGYRQRVGLAQALVGGPPVLILDEPTIGLDPKQIIEIRNLIRDLGKERTVILSSHVLSEVTALCRRVIIIHRGRIVASDTIESLSACRRGGHRLILRVAAPEEMAVAVCGSVPGARSVQCLGSREPGTVDLCLEPVPEQDLRRSVFQALSRENLPLMMMRPVDFSLEEIFIQLTAYEMEAS